MYRIIEFTTTDGSIEYLATDKSLEYFNKDYNPKLWKDGLSTIELAIDIAATLTAHANK